MYDFFISYKYYLKLKDIFTNNVIGNVLSLEASCKNRLHEFHLIRNVLIEDKLAIGEQMKEIIKFCNPSGKLVNKILVIEKDEHTLCLHLMKIYGEIKMSFPLEIIENFSILKEDIANFQNHLKDFNEFYIIKLSFIEQLNWEDMILVFLSLTAFKNFENVYETFRESQIQSKKKFSLQNNKSRIQNYYKEKKNTIHSNPNQAAAQQKKPSLLDNVFHNTLRMNALMEHFSYIYIYFIHYFYIIYY